MRASNGVEEIQSTRQRRQLAAPSSIFSIGTADRPRRQRTCATPSPRSAASCPTASSSRRCSRSIASGDPIAYYAAEATDMTLEQLSWYVDNVVAQRLLGGHRHGRGQSRRRRRRARSGSSSIRPSCRRYGITAAQVNQQLRADQHQRRRRPRRDRRLRAVGPRRSAMPSGAYQLGQTQISLGGGRTVKLGDIADVRDAYAEQRIMSKMNGRQVVSFGISHGRRARPTSPSTTRRRRSSHADRAGESAASISASCTTASIISRINIARRWRR